MSRTPSVSVTPSKSVTRTRSVTPSVSVTPSKSVSKTPSKSVTPSKSALNLSSLTLYDGSSEANACGQLSTATFYVQNPYNNVWINSLSRVYTNSQGTNGYTGYVAEYISSPEGRQVAYISNGVPSTPFNTCAGGCIIAGTEIMLTTSTSASVETLSSGSIVLSSDITNMPDSDDASVLTAWSGSSITGTETTAGIVSHTAINAGTVYNFNSGLLKTTEDHLHIVKRGTDWRILRADQVQVGDYFKHQDGTEIAITSINAEGYSGLVYKLNTETADVYYANGILTHNIK